MPLNFDFPVRDKFSEERVLIVTTQGRTEGYPVVGYVGDSNSLSEFSLEGVGRYGARLENVPAECGVWIILYKNGEFGIHESRNAVELILKHAPPSQIISVVRHDVPVPIGQRDDQPLQEIVEEFATIASPPGSPLSSAIQTATARADDEDRAALMAGLPNLAHEPGL